MFKLISLLVVTTVIIGSYSYAVKVSGEKLYPIEMGGRSSFGYIDKSGKIIIQPKYSDAKFFYEGLAAVRVHGKSGYINKTGKMIIRPQYIGAYKFSEGLARISIAAYITGKKVLRYGYINKKGRSVISPTYLKASNFSNGMAAVIAYSNSGPYKTYIKRNGERAFEVHIMRNGIKKIFRKNALTKIHAFIDGVARIKIRDLYGYINIHGKVIGGNFYKGADDFSNGMAKVTVRGKFGYINSKGKMIIKPEYSDANDFSDGLALVRLNTKWLYINKFGVTIIVKKYKGRYDFNEGLAPVEINAYWGYINKKGDVAISPKYDSAGAFRNGIALVTKNNRPMYIDRVGKVIWKQLSQQELLEGKLRKGGVITKRDKLECSRRYRVIILSKRMDMGDLKARSLCDQYGIVVLGSVNNSDIVSILASAKLKIDRSFKKVARPTSGHKSESLFALGKYKGQYFILTLKWHGVDKKGRGKYISGHSYTNIIYLREEWKVKLNRRSTFHIKP